MKNKSKKKSEQENVQNSLYYLFTMAMRSFLRFDAPDLPPSHSMVFAFIADRTLGWGKRWEVITQDHFLKGLPNESNEGDPFAGALKISPNTLRTALHRLIEMELISTRKYLGPQGTYTAYSLHEDHFVLPPDNGLAQKWIKMGLRPKG